MNCDNISNNDFIMYVDDLIFYIINIIKNIFSVYDYK